MSDSAESVQRNLPPINTGELPDILTRVYDPIQPDMQRLNEFLAGEFASSEQFVHELLVHVARFRGKQIRPACLFLAGRWLGEVTQDHVCTAGVIELIHTATLVHDDILDDAEIRRRVATVNRQWGERAAILLGDFLYSRAFTLSAQVDNVTGPLADTTHTVCRGELLQLGSAFDLELQEDRYYEIIRQKTAVLYALSCELGALLSGAGEDEQRTFHDFGIQLGMAFQIADDALDLTGDPQLVGKSLGTDLKKGKLTLPLIRLRECLQAGKLEEYHWLLEHPHEVGTHQRVLNMLLDNGILEDVKATAIQFVERAVTLLDRLPASPLRQCFEELAQFIVVRKL